MSNSRNTSSIFLTARSTSSIAMAQRYVRSCRPRPMLSMPSDRIDGHSRSWMPDLQRPRRVLQGPSATTGRREIRSVSMRASNHFAPRRLEDQDAAPRLHGEEEGGGNVYRHNHEDVAAHLGNCSAGSAELKAIVEAGDRTAAELAPLPVTHLAPATFLVTNCRDYRPQACIPAFRCGPAFAKAFSSFLDQRSSQCSRSRNPYLLPNTYAFESEPMVKPTGFREYDARWLFHKEINLMGVQALGMGLGTLIAELGVKPGDRHRPRLPRPTSASIK